VPSVSTSRPSSPSRSTHFAPAAARSAPHEHRARDPHRRWPGARGERRRRRGALARLHLAHAPQTQRTYRGSLERFATWLAEQHASEHGHKPTPASQAPVEALTADAIAHYLQALEHRGLSASTIRKDRAAINGLAKYLHALRAIDATEILMLPGPRLERGEQIREALAPETGEAVQRLSRARARGGDVLAARNHAVITLLGACGLRNEEVRFLRLEDLHHRGTTRGRTWLQEELPVPDSGRWATRGSRSRARTCLRSSPCTPSAKSGTEATRSPGPSRTSPSPAHPTSR